MTPRTRKLLTAAALATAFIAGPAAAREGAQEAVPQGGAQEAAAQPPAARRSMIARAVKGVESAARVIATADGTACRIGNGKVSMYSDSLYRCVTSAGKGEYVVFIPRRGSR